MQWIPNGKGLFTTEWEKIDVAPVSFLSYPSGKMRQITNDLNVYSGISLTADAKTIATTQNNLNARFAELPLAGLARQEDQTGELVWFTWLDNDTIVANGAGNLRVINLLKHETTAVNVKKRISVWPAVLAVGGTRWPSSAPPSRGIFVASIPSTSMAAD